MSDLSVRVWIGGRGGGSDTWLGIGYETGSGIGVVNMVGVT